MLINAMEVTGIEGTYRCTCESTMDVLRRNKDSLMAVLEAFVYDPLLNWRLIDNKPKSKKSKTHGEVRLNHYQHFSPLYSSSKVGLSVASKAGSTLSTGSSEGNMESLVDYHKVDKLKRVHTTYPSQTLAVRMDLL